MTRNGPAPMRHDLRLRRRSRHRKLLPADRHAAGLLPELSLFAFIDYGALWNPPDPDQESEWNRRTKVTH